MKNVPTSRPIRYCQYRFCPEPKEIPPDRRSDALYCCDEHGYMERNARQKDNVILNEDLKKLRENRKIMNFLYSKGKITGQNIILETLGFDFDVLTELISTDPDNNITVYRIFNFELSLIKATYKIKKID